LPDQGLDPVRATATAGSPAFVRFDAVSVTYNAGTAQATLALSPTDLGFARGDFVCIVGPSGCGKTTLMQTLAGFLKPTAGTVSVGGVAITGPGPDRGVVFQQAALFPWKTVAANAGFGPTMRGLPRAERTARVEYWLRSVGLWDFRDRYPYQLSGGMQQRLAIARALANEPELLLMDEPFGALDALTREKMQEELHAVWKRRGMTVLFITHSVDEAVFLGTEVVVMSQRPGRVLARIPSPFARLAGERDIRRIKAGADFVALREQVLGLIWGEGG
jgi:NitT/TauT family transport system ATP-binding protein/taurine transport system ATP-binding protein